MAEAEESAEAADEVQAEAETAAEATDAVVENVSGENQDAQAEEETPE